MWSNCSFTMSRDYHIFIVLVLSIISYEMTGIITVWFLNVSLFDALKELTSLNLSMNEFEGWIGNEGM